VSADGDVSVPEQPKIDPLAERKKLSFKQAEGVEPLPSQLKRKEISREFRAALWAYIHDALDAHRYSYADDSYLNDPWDSILRDAEVYHHHNAVDEFPNNYFRLIEQIKRLIMIGAWHEVLGWLEFVLKHPRCPPELAADVDAIMAHCRLGYRVFDGVVIGPYGSDEERDAIERTYLDLAATEFHGARQHLRNAAEELTDGHSADSIRESIHAVEAVISVLEPKGDFAKALAKALAKLDAKVGIHGAMKAGFGSLYGFTSDAKGIRHSLLDVPAAKVDETDALFMIGACAAFVSYLINKSRAGGILD
jgi:hypothetical protein